MSFLRAHVETGAHGYRTLQGLATVVGNGEPGLVLRSPAVQHHGIVLTDDGVLKGR